VVVHHQEAYVLFALLVRTQVLLHVWVALQEHMQISKGRVLVLIAHIAVLATIFGIHVLLYTKVYAFLAGLELPNM
jgi:hypothetical protein